VPESLKAFLQASPPSPRAPPTALLMSPPPPIAPTGDHGAKGGRPSPRDLIREEAARRLSEGALPPTLKRFGDELAQWLKQQHPKAPRGNSKTLRGHVRDLWKGRVDKA
jgi:hypothetical protein